MYGAQARNCAQYLGKGSRVFVDAELDWREWADPDEKKREAVTLRARQVLFESGRSIHVAASEALERNGATPLGAERTHASPVGVSAAGDGTASADDLPF